MKKDRVTNDGTLAIRYNSTGRSDVGRPYTNIMFYVIIVHRTILSPVQ